MIEYLVFVALHAAKASLINISLHVRRFYYLHIMLVDMSLATKSISVASSYYIIKGVFKTVRLLPLTVKPEEQDAWFSQSEACALRSPANNVY